MKKPYIDNIVATSHFNFKDRHIVNSSGTIVSDDLMINGEVVLCQKTTYKKKDPKLTAIRTAYLYWLQSEPEETFKSFPKLVEFYQEKRRKSDKKFYQIASQCKEGSIVAYKCSATRKEDWKLARVRGINKKARTVLIKFYRCVDGMYYYDRQSISGALVGNFENFVIIEK